MEEIKNRCIIWLYKNRVTNKRVFSKRFTDEGFSRDEWDIIGEINLDLYVTLNPELYLYKEH